MKISHIPSLPQNNLYLFDLGEKNVVKVQYIEIEYIVRPWYGRIY